MKRIATLIGLASMLSISLSSALAQQPAPNAVLVGSDSLVGSTVRNADGNDVGKVSRLMIDPSDGRVATVIIATGGTLGVGSNMISVPWSSVKVGQDGGKVIVTASQMLDTAPKAERTPAPSSGTDPTQRRQ
jgi:sporulation protein YlmC with PRC-barrel domain